jgi:16S rRNA (guanine527-N7)-methyltransferase
VTDPLALLRRGAAVSLGRPLEDREADLFEKYLHLLTKWSNTERLVGSTSPRWIVENVFLDSLTFLRLVPEGTLSLLDMGSGAGVPGVPIKIVRPELSLTLLESRRRRASFLSTVVRELPLPGVRVLHDRAEAVKTELAEAFDVVVMRCAGDVASLVPLASDLVVSGGRVVASGPPRPGRAPIGEWVTVEAGDTGRSRRFLVFVKP